jgi:hypothetical protein
MTKLKAYQLDIEKLRRQLGDVAYIFSFLGITEEHEHFKQVKPFLIIPEEPKSLEELSQEFDETLDKIIKNFKEKSEQSRNWAEYRYKQSSENQNSRFDFARKYGYFSERISLTIGDGITLNTSIRDNCEYSAFTIRTGNEEVGYWSIKPNIKVYLNKKPNLFVCFFSKLLLNFDWVDT